MQPESLLSKIRKALEDVRTSGQIAVDITALLAFLASVETEAPLDAEIRKLNHDSNIAHYKAERDRQLAEYKAVVDGDTEMFRSVIETAKIALSTSILVNGGATVALLAFLGNLLSKAPSGASATQAALVFSLIAFAVGVLVGAVATGGMYCAQYCYHRKYERLAAAFHVLTLVLVICSYVAFALGVVGAYHAFIK